MNLPEALADIQRVASEAPREALPGVLGALEQAKATAWARLAEPHHESGTGHVEAPERNLPVDEAARRLGLSKDWLYKTDLPFKVRIGKRVLFSARGLERWNRQRMGR